MVLASLFFFSYRHQSSKISDDLLYSCPVKSKSGCWQVSIWGCVSEAKQPSGGVLRKRCSENMKQIYRGIFGKGVLKIWSKFTGEHPCQSVISIKLKSNFIEVTLRHGCSPVNLLHFLHWVFFFFLNFNRRPKSDLKVTFSSK